MHMGLLCCGRRNGVASLNNLGAVATLLLINVLWKEELGRVRCEIRGMGTYSHCGRYRCRPLWWCREGIGEERKRKGLNGIL